MKEIRKIIEVFDSIDHSVEKVALASVVNVEESAYRRIGARMLVRSNGMWIGGISGGCLEGDALKRSQKAIFKNEPSSVVYDTMEDDKNQIGVGLGCNGRIEVLFTPIDLNDPNNDIEQLRKVVEMNRPAVILKVTEDNGDGSRLGKSLLAATDAGPHDFCGLSAEWIQSTITGTTTSRKSRIVAPEEQSDIKVLTEFIKPETRLVIVGDNYDVNALIGIAHELGWETYIIGKAKKLSKSAFRLAKRVLDYSEADQIHVDEYTAVILMSHDYRWDMQMLQIFLDKNPTYLGMLGPKKRMVKMQDELALPGLADRVNFFSPVGLDIGAESPEEIALSIAAEIVAAFRNRKGASLRLRKGTIHERENEGLKDSIKLTGF